MKGKGKGAFVALLVVAITAVAVMVGAATAAPQKPIVIGWAFDGKGAMAPFDGPALAAAQIRVKEWNAKGGVKGRKLKIITCDTQGNKPAIAKSCAAKLLGQGVDMMFTTCDVDFAAPVVQESINAGMLTVAPCIGTDQMGPKRFGAEGQARVLVRQRRAGRGLGDGGVRVAQGLEDGVVVTDNVIVYFKDVVKAFKARFKQLGGKIVAEESFQSLGVEQQTRDRDAAELREGRRDRDVDRRRVRRAAAVRRGAPHARQQHADPQLVGR